MIGGTSLKIMRRGSFRRLTNIILLIKFLKGITVMENSIALLTMLAFSGVGDSLAFFGLASFVSIIISIVVLIKFFSLCSDIKYISENINDFTKYYYKMQEFKNSKNI